MGSWDIQCCEGKCTNRPKYQPANIVCLIKNHCDENGWILCPTCKVKGYIKKTFKLQEKDETGKPETWEPYLRCFIPLGTKVDDTYQPYVFLISYAPEEKPQDVCKKKLQDVWFSYYKDTRWERDGKPKPGGKLKLGYGPGGPPVLAAKRVASLVIPLFKRGCLTVSDLEKLKEAIDKAIEEEKNKKKEEA